MKKKLLASLISIAMLVSAVPSAYAEETATPDIQIADKSAILSFDSDTDIPTDGKDGWTVSAKHTLEIVDSMLNISNISTSWADSTYARNIDTGTRAMISIDTVVPDGSRAYLKLFGYGMTTGDGFAKVYVNESSGAHNIQLISLDSSTTAKETVAYGGTWTAGDKLHIDVVVDTVIKKAYLYVDNNYCGSVNLNVTANSTSFTKMIFNIPKEVSVFFDNISFKGITLAESTIAPIISKISGGTAEVDDLEYAINILADFKGTDGDIDCPVALKYILQQITEYAEAETITIPSATGVASIEDDSIVSKESLTEISVTYDRKLDADTVDTAEITVGDATIVSKTLADDGKTVKLTFADGAFTHNKEYIIGISGLSDILGNEAEAYQSSFKTGIIPPCNVIDGGGYTEGYAVSWEAYDDVTTTATLSKDGGEAEEFVSGTVLNESGEYTLVFTSISSGLIEEQTKTYNFSVTEAFAPTATDVHIEGTMAVDETVTGKFIWADENDNDTEGEHIYRWLRGESADINDGTFEYIKDSNGNEIATQTYQLTEVDKDKYIVFEITPISSADPPGEKTRSVPQIGPCAPSFTHAVVTATENEGVTTLTATAEGFADSNGDAADEPIYNWYKKAADGTIDTTPIATGDSFDITSDYYNMQICVGITPVSECKPYNGSEVFSEYYITPTKPEAKNVKITASTSNGQYILTGSDTFYDINGDSQGQTTREWKNSSGTVIATGNNLVLTSSMNGTTVTYEVTPKSMDVPKDGDTVVVSHTISISTVGGGTGGGGGTRTNTTGVGGLQSVVPQSTTQPATQPTTDSQTLNDIDGHWANEAINALFDLGLISGVGDGKFEPDRPISRAEFVTMILKVTGIELAQYADSFGDVSSGDWYATYIQTALNLDLISEDDNFRPMDNITRQEAAKIICGIIGYFSGLQEQEGMTFSDADKIADWAVEFIDKAAKYGIFNGDDDGNFNPTAEMTRAESATVLYRMYKEGQTND